MQNVKIPANITLPIKLPTGSVGDALEVRLNFSVVNGALSILARQTADGSEGVRITYDGGLHVVSESKNPLGQAASALHTDGGVPLPPGTAGKWTLRVFIDKSIVEAHLNARRSITSRFYPQDLAVGTGAFGLKLHNAAPNATMLVDSVEVWGMRGIY
eukprot:gene3340-17343_t